jgi:hypothetical protein
MPALAQLRGEELVGVNVVVTVENSHHLSLQNFVQRMRADEWGARAIDERAEYAEENWTTFCWEGKEYFAWLDTPREQHIDLYGGYDAENPVQMTFFKILCSVEEIAGGPLYVGNDVVHSRLPPLEEDSEAAIENFWRPSKLDYLIPNWRDAKDIPVENPYLVY